MRIGLAAPLVLVFACGGTLAGPQDLPPTSQHATASFVFHYNQADGTSTGAIAARVEEHSRRIEARQAVDLRTLPYLLNGQTPSLTALSDVANRQIYDLGYVLGEFVVGLGGVEALRSLAIGRGDVNATFGFDQPTFEARWREYLRERYGV